MACIVHVKEIKVTARAILDAIESTLPTMPLSYRIALTGAVQIVDDPAGWSAMHLGGPAPAVICNGSEEELVTLSAMTIEPELVPEGQPLMQLRVGFPWLPSYVDCIPELLAKLGSAAHAYWAGSSSLDAGVALAEGIGRASPDPGFPRPMSPSVLIPHLHWISYWSKETCGYLKFSPKDARASLFARVIAVEGHGLVLQLTEDVLDLGRPEHLFAVERAYKAFPDIDRKWGL